MYFTNVSNIVRKLESTSGRNDKEAVLARLFNTVKDCDNYSFLSMSKRAFDTFETFGVKQVPLSTNSAGLHPDYAYHEVKELLNKLAARTLTGNAARDEIARVAELINKDDWNYFYRRVILKDLKCGVNVSTWNKVAEKEAPAYVVPVFSCQLAKDGAKEKKISGEKLVEVKLDGVRVISIVYPDGRVEMYSRNGKPLNNFPKVAETLSRYSVSSNAIVFDGEIMSSSFQDLMKQVHRKEDVQTDDAVLYLFDSISLDDFKAGKSNVPQRVRSELLRNTIGEETNVKVVNQTFVNLDTEEGQETMKRINRQAIEGGYEGIMLKDYDAPYEVKRTKSWLKVKPVIEVTLEVIDVEEGTGKFEGNTGALVCRGIDTGREISVNVGSGLNDDIRKDIWSSVDEVIGQLVEIKADAITQNQDGTYSLRFPRFKCFRGFKPGEKL